LLGPLTPRDRMAMIPVVGGGRLVVLLTQKKKS
jgi:hypothetical protein